MTHNVLTYLANKETARSNLAKEGETYRSNLAKEQETQRANLAKEAENVRYNTQYLTELSRSNKAKESQAYLSYLEDQRSNVARESENRRSNQAAEGINLLNARTRGLELSEERRHSKEMESQGLTGLSIDQQRAATAQFEAELKKYGLSAKIITDIANMALTLFKVGQMNY